MQKSFNKKALKNVLWGVAILVMALVAIYLFFSLAMGTISIFTATGWGLVVLGLLFVFSFISEGLALVLAIAIYVLIYHSAVGQSLTQCVNAAQGFGQVVTCFGQAVETLENGDAQTEPVQPPSNKGS